LAEPTSGTSTERVDLHGEWRRWADTPQIREQALARLESVPRFGFGRRATAEEIAKIDIDVMPDGTGLPEGSGTVERGRALYKNQCVQCHGADGRGADYDALAGAGAYTVGNFWPYATTLYDYIYRAMPQAVPGSLPPDDVYSLTAFVLHLNEILPADGALDRESLPRIEMPGRDGFVYDDRTGGAELK
jgi:cytochrome c